jgi:chorismate mutase
MKRKIYDPCHEKKVVKNVRYNVATSEESEDTTTQTLDD